MLNEKMYSRILYADDDADDRVIFREALGELRITRKLTVFANGVELMEYLSHTEELPQIVFLDLNMPKKSGYQCLQEIRSDGRFDNISVAIFSTSNSRQDIDLTYSNGADVYFTKPNDYSDLKQLLRKVLRRKLNHLTSGFSREAFLVSL